MSSLLEDVSEELSESELLEALNFFGGWLSLLFLLSSLSPSLDELSSEVDDELELSEDEELSEEEELEVSKGRLAPHFGGLLFLAVSLACCKASRHSCGAVLALS